ncbi:D-isomer specific 2-hydroxyacid dehydrogenase NAD-binding [Actinosynnema mirum DSM 43827]|uniref:D-isomer specific 2-hydroxyacid dehydrogenase NAD-binding n=1 Tax=Actinosynnema mirum (strain ATCC 29888 / DSM 43827 / JCM 3225 / NBRC 14064 / NCIMB 13271 / NRRL B-12336 / IMRU 3971 / 101) TaxID=446462 RepID=C6WHA2_ACTMD|nr:D-isomer specific 2-hydroxyacid dehydrogenase NAD-binding [Actinosynnema mirum DSM 43827]
MWIPRPVHEDAVALLRGRAEVVLGYGDRAVGFDEVCGRVTAILLRTDRVDGEMMRRAPRLRVVARHGVGVDTVDVEAAEELGIAVTTTPGANAQSVAEHAVALMLAVRRGIGVAVRGGGGGGGGEGGGEGVRGAIRGRELSGAVVGLVGFGRIAQRVGAICAGGFGMRVLAHDPMLGDGGVRAAGAEPVGLDELLSLSDNVSVHVPLTERTRGLIGAERLRLMPEGAVVVNTARGGVVDEDALVVALREGRLGGAGLDVTSVEPLPGDHPLWDEPNVVITPHVGAQTVEAMRRVALEAAERVVEHL